MSQAELAEIVDLSLPTITRIEGGVSDPKSKDLARLAKALGVSVAYLVGEEDAPGPEPSRGARAQGLPAPHGLAYWGEVVDCAREAAGRGDREELLEIRMMLGKALSSIESVCKELDDGCQKAAFPPAGTLETAC